MENATMNKQEYARQAVSLAAHYDASPPQFEMSERLIASYESFKNAIIGQYHCIQSHGFTFDHSANDPYASSKAMFEYMDANNSVLIYKTNLNDSSALPSHHPMMQVIDDCNGLLLNDIFRAVHDYMGHYLNKNSFNPLTGETFAFVDHARTLPASSYLALMNETLFQSSWVYANNTAKAIQSGNCIFADGRAIEMGDSNVMIIKANSEKFSRHIRGF